MGILMGRAKRERHVKYLTNRAEIVLGNGGVTTVDLEDAYLGALYAWYQDSAGYARTREKLVAGCLLHRTVIKDIAGLQIDHKNRKTLDNRKVNLRMCTHSENMHNRPCLLGGVGYRRDNGKWRARITVNNKIITLGQYATREEALEVRRTATIEYFGEFAFDGVA